MNFIVRFELPYTEIEKQVDIIHNRPKTLDFWLIMCQ